MVAVGRHWFRDVEPVDAPALLLGTSAGRGHLHFHQPAVVVGLEYRRRITRVPVAGPGTPDSDLARQYLPCSTVAGAPEATVLPAGERGGPDGQIIAE